MRAFDSILRAGVTGAPGGSGVATGTDIRGTTRLFPVFGFPVAQVKAPLLYNALFARTGQDIAVVPMEVAPDDYPVVLKGLLRAHNVPGAMVTIPHKSATAELVDACSDRVRIAGACNAVVRREDGSLHGELFDGVGLLHALEMHGFIAREARCLVVGAGGAGAAIAAALAEGGAGVVRLFDTREAQAASAAARLAAHYPDTDVHAGRNDAAGFDLVVNATPLGMEPADPLPIDVARLDPRAVVAEIVMKRAITPLVEAARARGCRTVLGLEMLEAQVPLYLDFFGLGTRGAATIEVADGRAPTTPRAAGVTTP